MDDKNTENTSGWGGARSGAGRPRQRFTLDTETANLLREITRLWREEHPEAAYTPAHVIEQMIYAEAGKRWGAVGSPDRQRWLAIARGETPA